MLTLYANTIYYPYSHGMMYPYGAMYVGYPWAHWLMFIFWVSLITGAVYGISRVWRRGNGMDDRRNAKAIDVLKDRYAKGEISKELFMEMKEDILESKDQTKR